MIDPTTENVQICLLISLLALAELNPYEFARTSEISKSKVQQKIETLIYYNNQEKDSVGGVQSLYEDLKRTMGEFQDENLRRLYLQNIHDETKRNAIIISNSIDFQKSNNNEDTSFIVHEIKKDKPRQLDEFEELSLNKLSFLLPDYEMLREIPSESGYIDAIFKPINNKLEKNKIIIVEIRKKLNNREKELNDKFDKIIKNFDSKNTTRLVISQKSKDIGKLENKVRVLFYDIVRDRFLNEWLIKELIG